MNNTTEAEFTRVNIARLREDPENARTHMDHEALEGLKESIRRWGVRDPLEVHEVGRDLVGEATYEVVDGNRRLRATNRLCADLHEEGETELLAARLRVPVKILTPEEVAERKYLQLMKNLQREDVSPLDEAKALRWLVEEHHDTPKELAELLGVTPRHIQNRLRIPDAPKVLLDALTGKLVTVKHCEIVGGIPAVVDRETLAYRVLNPQFKTDPLTVDETLDLIRRDYMVSLKKASKPGFDPDDAELLPEAGDCSSCPHLARNVEEVTVATYSAGGRGVDPMTCLNPVCARQKRQATLSRLAESVGSELLSETVCEKVFGGMNGEVAYDSEFVPVDTLPGELQKGWEGPTYLGRNPTTGSVVTLVPRELADEAKSNATPAKKSTQPKAAPKSTEKESIAALDRLVEAMFSKGLTEAEIDALTATELQETPDALALFRKWLKPSATDDVEAIAEMMEVIGAKGAGASTVYLAAAVLAYGVKNRGLEDPALRVFCERFGVEC